MVIHLVIKILVKPIQGKEMKIADSVLLSLFMNDNEK